MTTPSAPPAEWAVRLSDADAKLVLVALEHAVSYVLEEKRPEDRLDSEARGARFCELHARLLQELAAPPASPSPECAVWLSYAAAKLVLAALEHAVSYVLEEKRPEHRLASEARSDRFSKLRARLLRDLAQIEIRAGEDAQAEDAHA